MSPAALQSVQPAVALRRSGADSLVTAVARPGSVLPARIKVMRVPGDVAVHGGDGSTGSYIHPASVAGWSRSEIRGPGSVSGPSSTGRRRNGGRWSRGPDAGAGRSPVPGDPGPQLFSEAGLAVGCGDPVGGVADRGDLDHRNPNMRACRRPGCCHAGRSVRCCCQHSGVRGPALLVRFASAHARRRRARIAMSHRFVTSLRSLAVRPALDAGPSHALHPSGWRVRCGQWTPLVQTALPLIKGAFAVPAPMAVASPVGESASSSPLYLGPVWE